MSNLDTSTYLSVFDTEPEATPAPEPEPVRRRGRPGRPPAGDRRIERAVAICRLSRAQRELLARLAGVRGFDDSNAAVARLVDPATDAARLAEKLVEITEADALDAGVLAAELAADREAKATAWAVAGGEGPVPRAAELARALKGLPTATVRDLRAIAEAVR
jgi:hypothetical protein